MKTKSKITTERGIGLENGRPITKIASNRAVATAAARRIEKVSPRLKYRHHLLCRPSSEKTSVLPTATITIEPESIVT